MTDVKIDVIRPKLAIRNASRNRRPKKYPNYVSFSKSS